MLYFLHSIPVLSFCIDVVLTLSIWKFLSYVEARGFVFQLYVPTFHLYMSHVICPWDAYDLDHNVREGAWYIQLLGLYLIMIPNCIF